MVTPMQEPNDGDLPEVEEPEFWNDYYGAFSGGEEAVSDGATPRLTRGVSSETHFRSPSRKLRFRGANEIIEQAGSAPTKIAPYIFAQSITEIDGAIKA